MTDLVKIGRLQDVTTSLLASQLDIGDERWSKDYQLLVDKILTEKGQSHLFPFNWYCTKITQLNLNCFRIPEPTGTGLFLQSSLLNHSCVPNVDISFELNSNGRQPSILWTANQAIQKGEQLFCSYIDPREYPQKQIRRDQLMASYGFTCMCPACVAL
jgi:hypothetical protein